MPKIPPKPAKPRLEKDIQAEVRQWLAHQPDVTVFRNAQAYVQFADGHTARTGLGTGSADLIGSLTVSIGGHLVAIALGVEIKRPGQELDPAQVIWHREMAGRGWVTGVARSVEDAQRIIYEARERLK